MIFSQLWARITGADKDKAFPDQQASALGRLGDYTIIYPYGLYCNLPDDAWLSIVDKGKAISMTTLRPSDVERGEPVFFHPETNTRIIARNNGDLDIYTEDSLGNVNIYGNAIVNGNGHITGDLQVDGNFNVDGSASLGGAGGAEIARKGDAVAGGIITGGSANHTAT